MQGLDLKIIAMLSDIGTFSSFLEKFFSGEPLGSVKFSITLLSLVKELTSVMEFRSELHPAYLNLQFNFHL